MTDETTSVDTGNVATAESAEAVTTTTSTTQSTASWRDALPEDIRTSPSLSKFETQEGLAKSYINLEKMIGTDKVPLPKEGDTEGWDRWFKASGRPDTGDAKAYGFEPPKDLPSGLTYSEEQDTRLATVAHKAGLNRQQAALVREEFIKYMGEGVNAQQESFSASRETQVTQLKTEWGRAFDQNLKEAKLAVKEYGGEEFAAYLEETGLGNHPALAKAFHTIARKTMGENQLHGAGHERESTPADLDTAIADHRASFGPALLDRGHPEHKLRTDQLTALYNKRHG